MYISKSYSIPFLWVFRLDIYSDDRENGEYKHFIDVRLFGQRIINVCYRTGECDNIKNYYAGTITKYNLITKFIIESWDWFKSSVLWCNCSESVYRFWDKFNIFNHRSYYSGIHLEAIASEGTFKRDTVIGKEYEWYNNDMKFSIIVDKDAESMIKKDNYYKLKS